MGILNEKYQLQFSISLKNTNQQSLFGCAPKRNDLRRSTSKINFTCRDNTKSSTSTHTVRSSKLYTSTRLIEQNGWRNSEECYLLRQVKIQLFSVRWFVGHQLNSSIENAQCLLPNSLMLCGSFIRRQVAKLIV